MWGTLPAPLLRLLLSRFSPTGVGNVKGHDVIPHASTVQPHWCGERDGIGLFSTIACGSAPLVWGTLRDVVEDVIE